MPKKRKSRGRSKGAKGKVGRVPCSSCGALVPKDKIKKVTVIRTPVMDRQLEQELAAQGAYIPKQKITKMYCVSCAMFRGIISARAKEERKVRAPLFE